MDKSAKDLFTRRNLKWMAFSSLSFACLLCCAPISPLCAGSKDSSLKIQFDELEALIDEAEDPVQEAKQFLLTFLTNMEAEFGIKLSLPDACEIVKKNIHLFGIPEEDREALLLVLEIFAAETGSEVAAESKSQGIDLAQAIQFGWNLHSDKKIKPRPYIDLSARSVELFTGALLCMIPHQQAHAKGNEMILDGCNR